MNGDIDVAEGAVEPFDGVITVELLGVRCEHEQDEPDEFNDGKGFRREDKYGREEFDRSEADDG